MDCVHIYQCGHLIEASTSAQQVVSLSTAESEFYGIVRRAASGIQLRQAFVNTIHPEPEIHEQINVTKRLRNNVYNSEHILNNAERNVNNYVNDAMHVDAHKMQT